jgi:hypothetical protein
MAELRWLPFLLAGARDDDIDNNQPAKPDQRP